MPITTTCIHCGQLLREIPDLLGRHDIDSNYPNAPSERRLNCINPHCPNAGVVILIPTHQSPQRAV